MAERRCGTCAHYDQNGPSGKYGLCFHSITVFMRGNARHNLVPAAFSELEVTTMAPSAGKDCPTWQATHDLTAERAATCIEIKPQRFKRGERQRQCSACRLWFWEDEWATHKQLDRLASEGG